MTSNDTFMAFDKAPPGLCEHVKGSVSCRVEAQSRWPLIRRMCAEHAVRFLDPVFRGCGCGPKPCAACARHISAGVRVLVVGERENGPESYRSHSNARILEAMRQSRAAALTCPQCKRPHIDEGEWASRPHRTHRCVDDSVNVSPGCGAEWQPPQHLLQFVRRRRAFSWGGSRARLVGLGLRWDMSCNLPGASPKLGAWDKGAAEAVTPELGRAMIGQVDVAVLLGVRVQEAFSQPECAAALARIQVVHLPHPSGRNRAWNDQTTVARCRALVDQMYAKR